MTWQRLFSLMMLIIAAWVVDLPCPVGPVTSTSPCAASANSSKIGGNPSSTSVGIVSGISRNTAPMQPR